MSKLFIENSTLTAIGDAIREKTGKTALIAPGAMPAEIKSIVSGGGSGDGDCNGLHVPEEALVISGSCDYRFYLGNWDWFIEEYGNKITTKNLSSAKYMFYCSDLQSIPFELNFTKGIYDISNIFAECYNLLTVPVINNLQVEGINSMFSNCHKLKSIPDDLDDTWDWSYIEGATSKYDGDMSNMFAGCYNLRTLPTWTFQHRNPIGNYNSSIVYSSFLDCWSLERVEGIRLPENATWTSNGFNKTFENCCRLKSITFALQEDGTPYVHNISKQTIDLTKVGYLVTGSPTNWFLSYCDDFTEADKIDSWDKWETYFGDVGASTSRGTGNGYAASIEWCTFGRTAAKRLFATLPDVTGGSGNTIKLNSRALLGNNLMAGEAINDLTTEEIAVATARGWTVTKA